VEREREREREREGGREGVCLGLQSERQTDHTVLTTVYNTGIVSILKTHIHMPVYKHTVIH